MSEWGPTREDVVAAWPDHEAEAAYRAQIAREAYERGRRDQAAVNELAEAAQRDAHARYQDGPDADLIDRLGRLARQAQAGLEERRWGPRGREHFADPRPGDFPGREPRQEAEAG